MSDASLAKAVHIAEQAGKLVLKGFRTGTKATKKGPVDLVTEYDLAAERFIRDELDKAFPGAHVLGEEIQGGGLDGEVWVVDPIDGTTNFAHGHPFFCISIAHCQDFEPILGVIHAPALGITWTAQSGGGAYRNHEKCVIGVAQELSEALCVTGFPYDRRDSDQDNLKEFRAFLKRAQGVRRCGSAAIDIAMTADGTYDLFWEQKLKPWDFAAGILIAREAGGIVSDSKGHPADLRSSYLVAANQTLHKQALDVITHLE